MDPNTNQEPFGLDSEKPQDTSSPNENDRLLAGLTYLTQILIPVVMPIILLVTEETKGKDFLRFHAIQSLGLQGAAILWDIAVAIVTFVIPPLACLSWILFLVPAGVMAYYAYKAYQGGKDEVPYLTAFMRSHGWL